MNINTNIRQYDTDSEQVQLMNGQLPNPKFAQNQVLVNNK